MSLKSREFSGRLPPPPSSSSDQQEQYYCSGQHQQRGEDGGGGGDGEMVQRLTYRKRHSYATKSNQTRVVKTPGLDLLSSWGTFSFGVGFLIC